MPLPASRALPLIAAALIVTWIAQLPPAAGTHPDPAELPAVAHAWAAVNCGTAVDPKLTVRVQTEHLLTGGARFETIRETKGDAAACAEARTVAGLAEPGQKTPRRALRVTLFLP